MFAQSAGAVEYTDCTFAGQSGPGCDGNKEVLRIPQSSRIAGTSPSYCLVSYPGYLLGVWGFLPLCREAVGVFYSPRMYFGSKLYSLLMICGRIATVGYVMTEMKQ